MGELAAAGAFDGLGLPLAAGRCRLSVLPSGPLAVVTRPADGLRIGVAQWLVAGEGDVDVTDAFAGLSLAGADAAAVLERLVPIDAEAGLPARTLLRHTPVIVDRRGDGFALLVPRSYTASAVAEVAAAMRAVAARRQVADG